MDDTDKVTNSYNLLPHCLCFHEFFGIVNNQEDMLTEMLLKSTFSCISCIGISINRSAFPKNHFLIYNVEMLSGQILHGPNF